MPFYRFRGLPKPLLKEKMDSIENTTYCLHIKPINKIRFIAFYWSTRNFFMRKTDVPPPARSHPLNPLSVHLHLLLSLFIHFDVLIQSIEILLKKSNVVQLTKTSSSLLLVKIIYPNQYQSDLSPSTASRNISVTIAKISFDHGNGIKVIKLYTALKLVSIYAI